MAASTGLLGSRGLYVRTEAATDDQGNFRLPELPPASYSLGAVTQPSTTYHVVGVANIEVKPKAEATAELKAENTFPVRGRIIASDTGQGLAGARVLLERYTESGYYTSDGTTGLDGGFEVPSLPGDVTVSASADGYVGVGMHVRPGGPQVTVTPGGVTAPDIQLDPSHTLSVLVVGPAGEPVEDAIVLVGRPWELGTQSGHTDGKGLFEVDGLAAGPLAVWALKGDLAAPESKTINVGQDTEPAKLALEPEVLSAVTVQVIDRGGAPATDAAVKLTAVYPDYPRPLPAGCCDPPNDQGRVRVAPLRPGVRYQLRVEARDCDPTQTEEWLAAPGVTHDFGVVALQRATGVVAGTVVDDAGQPIPGVAVFNPSDAPRRLATTTDQHGLFRLEGLRPGKACVFVDSPQHRFAGLLAEVGGANVRVVLHPRQPAPLGLPPPPRPRIIPEEEARELAKGILLEALQLTKGAKAPGRDTLFSLLARIDLDTASQAAAELGGSVRQVALEAARARLEQGSEEALAMLTPEPGFAWPQVDVLAAAAEALEGTTPELARRCVREGLTRLKDDGQWTLCAKVRLATVLRRFDEAEATGLLAEAQEEAAALPEDQIDAIYARGFVAERTCELDLEAALALIEPLRGSGVAGSEYDRHLANIARHVAKTDPDKALALIDRLDEWQQGAALASAVAFFPRDQLARAVQLARTIRGQFERRLALTRLSSVAPPDQVPDLLEEAAAPPPGATASLYGARSDAQAMAHVACVARRLGYQEYEAFALRAASLLGPPGAAADLEVPMGQTEFQVADTLAFVSPDLARHIMESTLSMVGGVGNLTSSTYRDLGTAASRIDPQWALELVRQMPPDDLTVLTMPPGLPRAEAVAAVARALLWGPEEAEYEGLHYQYFGLPIDQDS